MLACGESAVPPSPGEGIFFPRRPPPTGLQVALTAAATGRLAVEDGCVWLVNGPARYLVVWPHSYVLADAFGTLVVLGPERTVVARGGQVVTLGGGEVAIDAEGARAAVAELAGVQIPAVCEAELAWTANGVIPGPP